MEKLKKIANHPYIGFILLGLFIVVFGRFEKQLPPDLYSGIIITSYYTIAGLGFALLLGYGGLASLGTGAFLAIGSFGFHYLYRHLDKTAGMAILIVLVLSLFASIFFGFVSLRISGLYLAIVTLALSQVVFEVIKLKYPSGTSGGFINNIFGVAKKPLVFFGKAPTTPMIVAIIGVTVTLTMILVYNLMKSATGRALLAVKNSETAAQTMGVNTIQYRLFAFIISGLLGTISGLLLLFYQRSSNVMGLDITFALNMLAAVIVGGVSSVWGIPLGSLLIFGLKLLILDRLNLGNYAFILNGFLIIVIVMFYPGGVIQLIRNIRNYIQKARNKYYGIEQ